MVKCKIGLISLIIVFVLVGCGAKESPSMEPYVVQTVTEKIVQEKEAWDYTDVKISGIPENAMVCTVGTEGIYYVIENSTDYSGVEPTAEIEFHFLDYSGNDRMLLQKKHVNTYNLMNVDNHMIFCNVTEEGMEIIELSPEGNVETLFTQNAPQFPFMQSFQQYMVSIRNNFVDNNMYENALVLRDMEKKEEKVIYRVLWDNEKGIGEDLGCVSMSNDTICFTVNKCNENNENEYILFLYDIESEEIMKEVSLPTRAYYAAYGKENGKLFLSQTNDSTYMEEAGAVGDIKNGTFVENAKIPFISASNMIREGRYIGNGYYFTTYDAAYYWDTKTGTIFVYDYQWRENSISRMLLTEDGLKYLVSGGDDTFVRTLFVK